VSWGEVAEQSRPGSRVIVCAALALLAAAVTLPLLGWLDTAVTAALEPRRSCALVGGSRFVGDYVGVLVLALAAVVVHRCVVEGWRGVGPVVLVLASLAAGCGLFDVLKDVVDRQRPGAEFLNAVGESFPSGHVANTLLLGVAILALWPRRLRVTAAVAVAVVVGVVAAARVYEGRHWPSDVLCTASLALAYALPAFFLPHPRWRAVLTGGAIALSGVLLVAARRGLHVTVPAAPMPTASSVLRTLPFGVAEREGRLGGAWTVDAADRRRSSAWLNAASGTVALGAVDGTTTMLRLVARPYPRGESAHCRWLRVELNGRLLGERLLAFGWRGYTFPIDGARIGADENQLSVSVSNGYPEDSGAGKSRAAFSDLTLHGFATACGRGNLCE
jgi:membrane-associated phospholipid phosphatase